MSAKCIFKPKLNKVSMDRNKLEDYLVWINWWHEKNKKFKCKSINSNIFGKFKLSQESTSHEVTYLHLLHVNMVQ